MRYCLRAEPACPALGGPAGPRPPPGVKGAAGGEASLDTARAAAVVASPHRGVVRPPLCGGPLPTTPTGPLPLRLFDHPHAERLRALRRADRVVATASAVNNVEWWPSRL